MEYEVDLYKPVKDFFTAEGYDVYGEVNDCDVVAVKEDELIIVELKLRLNLELVMQATKRQRLSDQVYVAIPKPKLSFRSQKWRDICYLMRRLEVGLLLVSLNKMKNKSRLSIIQLLLIERKACSKVKREETDCCLKSKEGLAILIRVVAIS